MIDQSGLRVHLLLGDSKDSSSHQAKMLIARPTPKPRPDHAKEEVSIILPSTMPARGQTISQCLSEALTGHAYTTSNFVWGSDISMLEDKSCISLLEIDDPVLSDLTEPDFACLKRVITRAKRLLWIVGFDGPSCGMISGLARVVRNEMPGISFQTVHADLASTSSNEPLSSAVTRVFEASTNEDEFKIQDGIVRISRIEEDEVANNQVQALMPNAPDVIDTILLREAGVPLKLCVQTPGMLDSLCFEVDDLPLKELEADEVEIDVKATALK